VRKYGSSPEPRAREIGRRWSRILLCGMAVGGVVLRSVMGNCACDIPEEGSRGVFHVKRMSGVGDWEVRVRERVGALGSLKL